MSTLTAIALNKMTTRFINTLSHATYKLDGVSNTIGFVRTTITDNIAKFYIWFDDTISGEISDINVIDTDGDTIAISPNIYTKTSDKALYISFKYQFTEIEV